ncbi:NAD-dependent epimerase/dehydratase family protein [Salmonirosea aquatica]|uniref:NAD-dependent epimerase/dehydratase family protein n=1 Tax=Salmonirosea aquatica TaxID=2654236 RepID=A0A7C9BEF7_9BACT|nr:NAD-dependent epimerase/dehydratase family protein [Cytophagaceae bacterium SJW1-29]
MRILITGATGLVGSATARRFLADGHSVSVLHRPDSDRSLLQDVEERIAWIEGDILDILSLEKALENVEYVIHAAAVVSFIPRDEAAMVKVNVEGTANVVNVCLKRGIRKLCHVSSVAALGRPHPRTIEPNKPVRIDETQRWEDSPNNSAYAKTKYLAELEVWRGISEGLPAVIVNPSLILGEGDWQKSSTQLFKYVYDGKPFYTEGTVNYVDVRDIAEAIYQLVISDIQGERFILSAGSASYQALFAAIAKGFDKRPPHLKVGTALAGVIWRIEAVRSWLTGSRPLITKDTARSATHRFEFENTKIKQAIAFDFQPLCATVQRVCESFFPTN